MSGLAKRFWDTAAAASPPRARIHADLLLASPDQDNEASSDAETVPGDIDVSNASQGPGFDGDGLDASANTGVQTTGAIAVDSSPELADDSHASFEVDVDVPHASAEVDVSHASDGDPLWDLMFGEGALAAEVDVSHVASLARHHASKLAPTMSSQVQLRACGEHASSSLAGPAASCRTSHDPPNPDDVSTLENAGPPNPDYVSTLENHSYMPGGDTPPRSRSPPRVLVADLIRAAKAEDAQGPPPPPDPLRTMLASAHEHFDPNACRPIPAMLATLLDVPHRRMIDVIGKQEYCVFVNRANTDKRFKLAFAPDNTDVFGYCVDFIDGLIRKNQSFYIGITGAVLDRADFWQSTMNYTYCLVFASDDPYEVGQLEENLVFCYQGVSLLRQNVGRGQEGLKPSVSPYFLHICHDAAVFFQSKS